MIEAREAGLGLCLCPGELPPIHGPWFLDNGAFRAFTAGMPFNESAFVTALVEAATLGPDFVVAPDVVAGGLESLAVSLAWCDRLPEARYLAVQDGMSLDDVDPFLARFAGIFVGGSVPWKLRTGVDWVALAHEHGKRCHIGRVGNPKRLAWAREIGADSVDSSQPLWTNIKWRAFLAEVHAPAEQNQGRLFA